MARGRKRKRGDVIGTGAMRGLGKEDKNRMKYEGGGEGTKIRKKGRNAKD